MNLRQVLPRRMAAATGHRNGKRLVGGRGRPRRTDLPGYETATSPFTASAAGHLGTGVNRHLLAIQAAQFSTEGEV